MSAEIRPIQPTPPSPPIEKVYSSNKPPKTEFQKTIEKIKKVLLLIKDKIWAFPREAVKFVGSVLRIVASGEVAGSVTSIPTAVMNGALHVNKAIGALGALSFVNMLLNFLNIPFKVKDAVDDQKKGDKEGTALNAAAAVASGAEVVYDMSLGVAALTAVGAIPFIAAFSLIVVPLAIVVLTYATAKGIYDIVQQGRFLHSIPLSLPEDANGVEILKSYLDKKLGVQKVNSEITFSAKKNNVLKRRADKKIVKLMKHLRMELDREKPDMKKANAALKHMKGFMWRKIGLESVGVVVNLAMLGALIASAVLPGLTVIVVPVVGGVKSAIAIARLGTNFGLTKWQENNIPVFDVVKP